MDEALPKARQVAPGFRMIGPLEVAEMVELRRGHQAQAEALSDEIERVGPQFAWDALDAMWFPLSLGDATRVHRLLDSVKPAKQAVDRYAFLTARAILAEV